MSLTEPVMKKLVINGDGAVGKTCLLIVRARGEFPQTYIPTEFDNHTTIVDIDGVDVGLSLWDHGGGEDYDRLRPLVYPDTDVFLLCFAVDSRYSFENIAEYWIPEMRHYCPHVPIILVGNKTDLREDERTIAELKRANEEFVSIEEGEEMAAQINAYAYVECSSLRKEGIHEVFEAAAKAALYPPPPPPTKKNRCLVL